MVGVFCKGECYKILAFEHDGFPNKTFESID